MKAKEKAHELVEKMNSHLTFTKNDLSWAKKCAIICVNELIDEVDDDKIVIRYNGCRYTNKEYWQQVKFELEQL